MSFCCVREEIAAVVNVMRNVEGQTQGSYLAQFQEDFAAFTGAGHAFAVDNATNALSLAATLCGLRPGDEVIRPRPEWSWSWPRGS